jgi:AcrB/AcrD/AcrF family
MRGHLVQVPLKDVATVRVAPEPVAVAHDDVLCDVEVVAKVSGDPGSVVSAVRSRLAAMPMPYEYHAEVFGNAAVRRADLARVLAYGAAALIGIFLLLQAAAAANWRRAGLLLLSLPLSVVGGVITAPLAGGVWSIAALAGLFAALALAIRGAVQLGDRVPCRGRGGRGDRARRRARSCPWARGAADAVGPAHGRRARAGRSLGRPGGPGIPAPAGGHHVRRAGEPTTKPGPSDCSRSSAAPHSPRAIRVGTSTRRSRTRPDSATPQAALAAISRPTVASPAIPAGSPSAATPMPTPTMVNMPTWASQEGTSRRRASASDSAAAAPVATPSAATPSAAIPSAATALA